MKYNTKVEKSFYSKQWKAETYIDLDKPNMKLSVSTLKTSRGLLVTYCQAVKVEGNIESFVMYQDYNKQVKTFPEVKKVTEKSVLDSHNKALAEIDRFVEEANDFYK